MNKPRLSIIIPTYNSAKTIEGTLNSIVSQQAAAIECMIIDGRSHDDTIDIVKKMARNHPFIQYVSEADKGIYDAMNKGIERTTGDYLYFMGSDDVFYNAHVLKSVFAEPAFGTVDLIYGDVLFKHSGVRHGEEKTYLKLIRDLDNIPHQSIFYARGIFNNVGTYDLKYSLYADYDLNIKCFRNEVLTKKYIGNVICIFNEKGASHYRRSQDRFITYVHELYVKSHEDPVALYDTLKYTEARILQLLESRDYRLGKMLGDGVRKIKGIAKRLGL
jgi:glycosyltransferase involved in cell wall biosynthesis